MNLESKILYIQSAVDQNFRMILNRDWNSGDTTHRQQIRSCLSEKFTHHFSRAQLARLSDLTWLPEASDGFLSISHCRALGGFTFSSQKHGFDAEETRRISINILKRTCNEDELNQALRPEFLWVAKEAGFKALSEQNLQLVVGDLVCSNWQSHFENQVFSFRLNSEKTLDFGLNKGFIFSDEEILFGVFFR